MKSANEELNEANVDSRRAKRKYVVLSFMVVLGLAIAAMVMLM